MLIVNADDFGAAPSATDGILRAWREGTVTSASAMVWMGDSDRASRLTADQMGEDIVRQMAERVRPRQRR